LGIFWDSIATFGVASMGSRISDAGRKAALRWRSSQREKGDGFSDRDGTIKTGMEDNYAAGAPATLNKQSKDKLEAMHARYGFHVQRVSLNADFFLFYYNGIRPVYKNPITRYPIDLNKSGKEMSSPIEKFRPTSLQHTQFLHKAEVCCGRHV